jgi:hypothetical protein
MIAQRFNATEEKLKSNTERTWTILRGGYFITNLVWQKDAIGGGVFATPFGDYSFGMISVQDIGRCAATVAASGGMGHASKIYEMSGEKLNGRQVAAVMTEVFGYPVQYVAVPLEQFAKVGPKAIYELAELVHRDGDQCIPHTNDVSTLTGSVTTVKQWLTANKSLFPKVEKQSEQSPPPANNTNTNTKPSESHDPNERREEGGAPPSGSVGSTAAVSNERRETEKM